eukprot:5099066-Pyramimonas_sp.AAC.1
MVVVVENSSISFDLGRAPNANSARNNALPCSVAQHGSGRTTTTTTTTTIILPTCAMFPLATRTRHGNYH